jgi:hypothetical protein
MDGMAVRPGSAEELPAGPAAVTVAQTVVMVDVVTSVTVLSRTAVTLVVRTTGKMPDPILKLLWLAVAVAGDPVVAPSADPPEEEGGDADGQ